VAALSAHDIVHNVPTGGHIAVCRFAVGDIDDVVEEEGLAMLTTEVSADDIIVVG